MSTPLLSILIVSYNTKEMTIECIASVFEQTRLRPIELIVWDNASSDGSPDAIGELFGDRIQLIKSDKNLGFAAANNRAAELALGDRLLLLNPDTVILNGAIDHLAAFADRFPLSGIWGGRTLSKDRTLDPSWCGTSDNMEFVLPSHRLVCCF